MQGLTNREHFDDLPSLLSTANLAMHSVESAVVFVLALLLSGAVKRSTGIRRDCRSSGLTAPGGLVDTACGSRPLDQAEF